MTRNLVRGNDWTQTRVRYFGSLTAGTCCGTSASRNLHESSQRYAASFRTTTMTEGGQQHPSHPIFDRDTLEIMSSDGRLRLRPVRLSDAANLRDRCADPLNVKYLPHLQGKESQTVEQVEQWIQTVMDGFNKDSLFLVVEDTASHQVIAEGPLGFIDWDKKEAESGIMVDHQRSGQGIATEALKTSMTFAFTNLGLEAVRYGTLQDNKAMVQILSQKLPVKPQPTPRTRKDGLLEYNFVFTREEWLATI